MSAQIEMSNVVREVFMPGANSPEKQNPLLTPPAAQRIRSMPEEFRLE